MLKAWKSTLALCAALLGATGALAAGGTLATAPVRVAGDSALSGFDGVVEAVRQTVVAAQVAGAVTSLEVKVGDTVKAGQVLARIDARTADYAASASDAQVRSAQALLEMANKDYQRQKQLFDKQYISQAALERAESQYKATQAQAAAQLAQASAARTQTGLHVVRAPYAGVVSEVPVALGDMAMPGRALLTLYQPGALRVSAAVPQSALGPTVRRAPVSSSPGCPKRSAGCRPSRCRCCRRSTRPRTRRRCASRCRPRQRVWRRACSRACGCRRPRPAPARGCSCRPLPWCAAPR